MGKWFDHVQSWYERIQNDPKHGLLVRYEDLKMNSEETIRRIAKFVGTPIDDDDDDGLIVKHVQQLTSLESMRQADQKDLGLRFMRWLGVLRKHHIRQGQIRSEIHELQLSSKHKQILKIKYELKLKPLGIPRDWVLLN